jgi:GalNAc-alpha-(1->4)-GalNAc-alpha-(1->3)-diNAcBac-PP-undecaprenol alpha-1,4-N-acetyl-D-galactosaminyltransferase
VTVQADATVVSFARMVPGIRKLAVIPNPLPAELADPPGRRVDTTGAPGARKRIMAMGRLVGDKQFDLLIDAFGGVASAYADWDLWIWGEGPDRNALAQRIAARGLTDRVRLAGRTESPWDELARAQLFVLSSAVEGFPNVLLEAMALGLPCVAFDCPSGPAEMTRQGKDALLVPAGDVEGLRQTLARMMSDPALRRILGERAAVSVRRRYALAAVLAEWDGLFEQVGARPTRTAAGSTRPENVAGTLPEGSR